MHIDVFPLPIIVLAAMLSAGCSSAPSAARAPAESIAGCSELVAEMSASDAARSAALEKQQGAWRAVIPFAVAARYAIGKSERTEADQRRADLQRQFEQRDCVTEGVEKRPG